MECDWTDISHPASSWPGRMRRIHRTGNHRAIGAGRNRHLWRSPYPASGEPALRGMPNYTLTLQRPPSGLRRESSREPFLRAGRMSAFGSTPCYRGCVWQVGSPRSSVGRYGWLHAMNVRYRSLRAPATNVCTPPRRRSPQAALWLWRQSQGDRKVDQRRAPDHHHPDPLLSSGGGPDLQ